jgi:hypothetical protein
MNDSLAAGHKKCSHGQGGPPEKNRLRNAVARPVDPTANTACRGRASVGGWSHYSSIFTFFFCTQDPSRVLR